MGLKLIVVVEPRNGLGLDIIAYSTRTGISARRIHSAAEISHVSGNLCGVLFGSTVDPRTLDLEVEAARRHVPSSNMVLLFSHASRIYANAVKSRHSDIILVPFEAVYDSNAMLGLLGTFEDWCD